MKRIRSPSYPARALPEVVDRMRRLFEKKGSEPGLMSRIEVLQAFGFTGAYGPSYRILAAAKKFGLLSGRDTPGYAVTKEAMTIVHPASPADRSKALHWALRQPRLYASLLARFPDGDPSDEELREILIEARFSKVVIPGVIAEFRASVQYAAKSVDAQPDAILRPDLRVRDPNLPQISFSGDKVKISDLEMPIEDLIAFLQQAAKALGR